MALNTTDYRAFQPSPRPRSGVEERRDAKYRQAALDAAKFYEEKAKIPGPPTGREEVRCAQCGWGKVGTSHDASLAALYRHVATHYDPVSRREDGPGIAKLKKPEPDNSVAFLDVDLLCADE